MADRFRPEKVLLPVVAILVLLLLATQVPPLLLLIGVLIPVPLIFVYVQFGRRPGITLFALVFTVLFLLVGPKQAFVFFAEYAVMAGIMAESIRLRFSFDKCILLSTLMSALVLAGLFFMLIERESTITEFFQKQIEGHFEQSMEALNAMGKPGDVKVMHEFADKASGSLAQLYPSLIVMGIFVTAVINYYTIRALWGYAYSVELFHPARFSEWVIPDQVVWLLISSGLVSFLVDNTLGTIAVNLLFIVSIAYFLQGLAILINFLESRNVPVFFWVLIFFIVIFQPLLIGVGIGLGIFDTWVDFRKIRGIDKQVAK